MSARESKFVHVRDLEEAARDYSEEFECSVPLHDWTEEQFEISDEELERIIMDSERLVLRRSRMQKAEMLRRKNGL